MTELAISNTFQEEELFDHAKWNTNYSDIVDYLNERNEATTTWDAFRIYRTDGVGLTVNNGSGSFSVCELRDNGTSYFTIDDGGTINAPGQVWGRMYLSSNANFVTIGPNKVSFTSYSQSVSVFDGAGKFTCPVSGKYLISGTLYLDYSASSGALGYNFVTYIYKNGSSVMQKMHMFYLNDAPIFSIPFCDIVNLSTSDTIEIYYSTGLAAGTISGDGSGTRSYCNFMKLS